MSKKTSKLSVEILAVTTDETLHVIYIIETAPYMIKWLYPITNEKRQVNLSVEISVATTNEYLHVTAH